VTAPIAIPAIHCPTRDHDDGDDRQGEDEPDH